MTVRILIADADRRLTEIYREHLECLGLAVRTAADAVVCVHLLREFRPHLLLLGTSLPWGGCDGVLALIQEEPDLRPEFVLILAARSDRSVLYRLAPATSTTFSLSRCLPCVWNSISRVCWMRVRTWHAQGASGRPRFIRDSAGG